MQKGAINAHNYSQCDSLLMGDKCGAHTFPYMEVKNTSSKAEHEATTSKIGEDQIFLLQTARPFRRRCGKYDCQRVLQGSFPRIADGVCS